MGTDDGLSAARSRIAAAFDPDTFEQTGRSLVALLAEHQRGVQQADGNVLNWADPRALVAIARQTLEHPVRDESIPAAVASLAGDSLARGINMHHPRYVGHQVPASVPLAALFDLVGSATNQVMAIYEMGPWATAVEHAVTDAVGQQLGFPAESFAGLITSGGSLANLTALTTARNVSLGDAWTAGVGGRQPVLVTHAESHYSVTRSAGILGLGTENVVRVGIDSRRRMDPNQLDRALADLRGRNVPIAAVSAGACATPIGAFDPLNEIADVCQRHGVWLHVDAAHGGAVCFSDRHRHLIEGISRADSVVCDAHKMMFMPALCAMVFYRDRAHRFSAFHQSAPYLFDPTVPELAEFESGLVTVECTKRAAALGVWGVWSLFGRQLFGDMVDVTFDLAGQFYDLLCEAEDFDAPYRPQCNIVVFRYLPPTIRDASEEAVNAFQLRLRRRVIESGEAYLVANSIDGQNHLRTTIINPLTTLDDLRRLLEILRRHGTEWEKP